MPTTTEDAVIMSNIEKMETLQHALRGLMEQLDIRSLVVSVSLDATKSGALWLPGCGPECEDPAKCAAKNFVMAGAELVTRGEMILDDQFEGVSNVTTGLRH